MQQDGIASLARLVPTWLQNVFPRSIAALKLLAGSMALVRLKKMAPWIARCVFTGEGIAALGRPQWKSEIVVDFICTIWEEILLECTRISVTVAITKVMLKRMYLNKRAPDLNYLIFCTDVKYFIHERPLQLFTKLLWKNHPKNKTWTEFVPGAVLYKMMSSIRSTGSCFVF